MRANVQRLSLHGLIKTVLLLTFSFWVNISIGHPIEGSWYQSDSPWQGASPPDPAYLEKLQQLEAVHRTGGTFIYSGTLEVSTAGRYVIDFSNTGLIATFEHRIYDTEGTLLTAFKGGNSIEAIDPYAFRHGRLVELEVGGYEIVSNISAPFFIAPPNLYIGPEKLYLQHIKSENLLTGVFFGVFLSMAFLYLCFAYTRRNLTDLAYATFILGNLFYFSYTLNVLPDLFNLHWFGFASWPIFISNIAYIFFVMNLLQIKRTSDPSLFWAGAGLIGLLVLFAITGAIIESWAMELNRLGVALFLAYGLSAALERVFKRDVLARYYMAANFCFLVVAAITISSESFGSPTLYIAHLGLIAVGIEVFLLSLVQAYQMNQINLERLNALDKAERSSHAARTDTLTGAPNRHAFEETFKQLGKEESFTYIDLDGLKYYNDHFGHHKGDELIRDFAKLMMTNLPKSTHFFRIAGDEFGIIFPTASLDEIEACIDESVVQLKGKGYSLCGASYGHANYDETDTLFNLRRIADARMYEVKQRKKASQQSQQQMV